MTPSVATSRRRTVIGAIIALTLMVSACGGSSNDLATACTEVDVTAMTDAATAVIEADDSTDLAGAFDAVATLLNVTATELGPVASAVAVQTGDASLNEFESRTRTAASDMGNLATGVRNGESLDAATDTMGELFAGLGESLGAGLFSGESGELLAGVPECQKLDEDLGSVFG